MNLLQLGLLLILACSATASEIAVTFDDLPVVTSSDPIARQRRITRDLLAHLTSRKIPAVGLVNTSKLATPAHVALLDRWLEAGFDMSSRA